MVAIHKKSVKSSRAVRTGLVIPAYNEATVISSVLSQLEKAFSGRNIEIIVVNDGSADRTADEVRKHKKVTLLSHIINMGAGAATRTGLAYAARSGCEQVITMDADGQHAVEDVESLIQAIGQNEADFIIGSRLIDAEGMPWYRIFGNKLLNFITFVLFGVFVTDSQSGLKALNGTALKRLEFHSNNYAFCSEMVWQAKRADLRIKEIPIKAIYTDYSLTKGQRNIDVVHILRQLMKRRLMDLING